MQVSEASQSLSPPVRQSQSERTGRSDAKMFDAAVKLIVEQGSERTTLKAVGELAGYSRGLAGARFKSKTGLFNFVVKRVTEYWLEEIRMAIGNKIGYAAICAAIDAHYRFSRKTPLPVRAFYILWFESVGVESDVRDTVLSIHRRRLSDVVDWIEQGISAGEIPASVDADAVARHFLTMMFGIVYQWLIDPGQDKEIKLLHQQLKQSIGHMLKVPEISDQVE
ncbi:MAG: AcrR family transcriptional regulator [Planctomycetota bacterium]|jgi:AcrR family transcriptional regulator